MEGKEALSERSNSKKGMARFADCVSFVSSGKGSPEEQGAEWDRMLPSDYEEILSRSVTPLSISSKKDAYGHLCNPILIDGGRKSFVLEKSTGKKCYTLSARHLCIPHGDNPRYWRWLSLPAADSRFPKVAELLDVCWLEITGSIHTKELSPRTQYAAFLILKLSRKSHGLEGQSQVAEIRVEGSTSSKQDVCLQPSRRDRLEGSSVHRSPAPKIPYARDDGWMEMELGEFCTGEGPGQNVSISFKEVEKLNWKGGLLVQGIELRPTK